MEQIEEGVASYFWHDNEGAHVTTQPHTVGTDFNALISSSTVALRKGITPYVQLDGTNQRVLIGSTENQRTVVTNDGMEVQGGSYTYGGTTSTFVPVKLWGTVQSSSGNEYKLLASQRHGASLIQSTYTYNVANSQISQVDTTEEIVTYTHASKSLLINKWSGSSVTDYRASVGTTGAFLLKGLNSVLSVGWDGQITTRARQHKFADTTVNFGDGTSSHLSLWGNATNKVGILAQNTAENKGYGLLARASELMLYNYSDSKTVWSMGAYYKGTQLTTTVPAGGATNVMSLTLPAGTYVITATMQWVEVFTNPYYLEITGLGGENINGNPIVRSTGTNGGGSVATVVVRISSQKTIYLSLSQTSGSTKTVNRLNLNAVRIM